MILPTLLRSKTAPFSIGLDFSPLRKRMVFIGCSKLDATGQPCTTFSPPAKLALEINKPRNARELSQARRRHATERPSRLFRNPDTQAAQAAERRAYGGVDRHQCR